MPRYLSEFKIEHIWIPIGPMAGIILWIWAFYDWGMRRMSAKSKFSWLMILIFTMGFGAIVYFLLLGLHRECDEVPA